MTTATRIAVLALVVTAAAVSTRAEQQSPKYVDAVGEGPCRALEAAALAERTIEGADDHGRALQVMTLDAKLDPPLPDRHVVMGGVRLTDPLEQHLLDTSMIEQLTVDDLRKMTPPVPSRPSMMGASIAALNRMIAGAFAACKPADADRAS